MTEMNQSSNSFEGTEIAIIGMAGRFPGATNINEFWGNLVNGIESISFFEKSELELNGLLPNAVDDPHYVRAGGVLHNVDEFDADFFGFYPKEAAITDPQQRLFLECAWEALENSGYSPDNYKGWIGVFAGAGMNTYLIYNLVSNQEILETVNGYQLTIANDKDFLATRVSYKLNLRGPGITVQSACSTSLVATHLACQSLLSYQCDLALAGGVQIRLPQKQGYIYQEGGILSPDGHCRAFDNDAQGTVGGNGAGVVVLKRLEDAISDGDFIYAIIKGSAINNDGSSKVGYTAPSVEGQSEVVAMAQAVANVEPDTIGYIETHGTGTSLGDPIEITALTQVFRKSTEKKKFCAIGSVKPNVGHLDAAAGITSLIKTTLALHNKVIPPSINFNKPNSKIDFENSPFFVNTEIKPWTSDSNPLRAGVSSFGIGGTNAHVILEEAPITTASSESRPFQFIMLSARSDKALSHASENMVNFISRNPTIPLSDIAYTLNTGRKSFKHREFVIARNHLEAIDLLTGKDPKKLFISEHENGKPQIVFMFPGQGSQYVNMARVLYLNEPIFKENFDHCAEILLPYLSKDIRSIIYPKAELPNLELLDKELQQTQITQPALFSIEYALSQLLISWGIKPAVGIGHSIGEYVMATLAEVFTLKDALYIVAERGRLMQSVPEGSMISVSLSEKELLPYVNEKIALAAINGPNLCVLTGPDNELENLIVKFNREGIIYRKLHTSHAFHSFMMDSILDEFITKLSSIDLHPPKLRFISNLTGTWITKEQAMSPRYWANHLRFTVRFYDGIDELMKDPSTVFLEVGPGRALSIFVKSHPSAETGRQVFSTIRHPQDVYDDQSFLLTSVGKLWQAGVDVNWKGFYAQEKRKKVPLPTYPFDRQKFWISPGSPLTGMAIGNRDVYKRDNLKEWLYLPMWKSQPFFASRNMVAFPNQQLNWLVFNTNDVPLSKDLIEVLKQNEQSVFIVNIGETFNVTDETTYEINPNDPTSYRDLFSRLKEKGWLPDHILHLWLSDSSQRIGMGKSDEFQWIQNLGFSCLINIAQNLSLSQSEKIIKITSITNELFSIFGNEPISPEKSMIIGASQVISQEYPNITCKIIDQFSDVPFEFLTNHIIADLLSESNEPLIALRNLTRWTLGYQPGNQYASSKSMIIKESGTYLITGGLGRIGLVFTEFLVRKYHANVILLDKILLPHKQEWEAWIESHEENDATRRRLLAIKDIEKFGTSINIIHSDLSDRKAIASVFDLNEVITHSINGIFHLAGFVGPDSIIPIDELSKQKFQAHLEAKVFGLLNLVSVIDHLDNLRSKLDFFFIQSSLSTVLGGLGLAAYSAVNHFMDSFASARNRQSKFPWITVDWDGWIFKDASGEPSGSGNLKNASITGLSMTPEEGLQELETILENPEIHHWIVATSDLDQRINQWIKVDKSQPSEKIGKSKTIHSPRPKLHTPYVAPRDAVEESIALMWSQILGIADIGVYDDFFEMGGHSLLATQLVTRIRDTFHLELPLRKLFESPNIDGLATLVKENKKEIKPIDDYPIDPISRELELPLSFGQQRLWFLDQLDPGTPLYNNFTAFVLKGKFEIEAFKKSIREIVTRHESLRTIFQEINGQPKQVILPEIELPITFVKTDKLEVEKLALEEAREPFQLSKGPLFRIKVIQVDPLENVLFMTAHHIISDGWSVNVMVSELITCYSAFFENRLPVLGPMEIQYADYAAWQRKWMSGDRLSDQINYWKTELDGIPPSLDLPYNHPRPSIQTSNGASRWFEFSEELTAKLNAFSKEEGLTVFMLLVGGVNVLLHKYTGEEDIVIGTPIANRNRLKTEGLIGFLLNVLVLRNTFTGNTTIKHLLKQVKETSLNAYAHQDLPFELLVEALQIQRDMSRSPIFQVILDFQDTQRQELRIPGLEFNRLQIDTGTTKYDLAISMEDHGNVLGGYFNYNIDLFDTSTIDRMISSFEMILKGIVTQPNLPVIDLNVLPDFERGKIIEDWNAKEILIEEYEHFLQSFDHFVNSNPERIAVSYENQELTYLELDQRANQLAIHLQNLGISSGMVVGMLVDRSITAIISMIGIWKSGGTYLPLDPGLPTERLTYILNDANVKAIIIQQRLYDNLVLNSPSFFDKFDIVIYEKLSRVPQSEVIFRSDYKANYLPDSIAYIIYTSGSTGRPKGVAISNRAISDHLKVIRDEFRIVSEDRVLQFSAYSFDQSIEQILVTLIAGAQLVLRGPELWEPAQFTKIVSDLGLTVVNIQPAYWQQWSQASSRMLTQNINTKLKLVIIGGDVVLPEHVRLWWQTPMRKVRLLNAYGPTETTITASTFEIVWNPDGMINFHRVPIGRPLANRRFYVLDKYQKLVPVGVAGELYIGGRNLSSGYLNQDELTNTKFIENPFLSNHQQEFNKLYRTGDLVRYLNSGDLEFLGRVDLQVKVRGFRIELGEIETLITSHPKIDMAVIVVKSDKSAYSKFGIEGDPSDKKLVAYVTLKEKGFEIPKVQADLRNYLKNLLPAYMVPTAFIVLDQLPLLTSGKVDRKTLINLSDFEGERPELASAYVAPRTQVEMEIASVWSEVLGVKNVGIYDNFFELGGHSLLATQIISRLKDTYNVEIPLRNLFESPTIESFATAIAQNLVKQEVEQSGSQSIEDLLNELEGLSDDEIKKLLEGDNGD